ncbi:MAG: YicC family protein [Gammaproteobacteria bacterium]|nr:YicC family protein [Gammaproteobacteria bacterium]
MMLSMTAFSRQQLERDWGSLTWEIRSVNHRYLETSIRLPDALSGMESSIREIVRGRLQRGKVECRLRFRATDSSSADLQINKELAKKVSQANSEIQKLIGSTLELNSIDVLRWPGVIIDQQFDTEALSSEAIQLFKNTLKELIASREREGEAVKGMLFQRIASIRQIVASVRERMPHILDRQRQFLSDKLEELKAGLDPIRLEQEITLLAQKADVDEELDRLDSHLNEVERVIEITGQKGRRLDFLMQELNREANTLSSKSIVVETTLDAVELKVLIEQMREQIQNVE